MSSEEETTLSESGQEESNSSEDECVKSCKTDSKIRVTKAKKTFGNKVDEERTSKKTQMKKKDSEENASFVKESSNQSKVPKHYRKGLEIIGEKNNEVQSSDAGESSDSDANESDGEQGDDNEGQDEVQDQTESTESEIIQLRKQLMEMPFEELQMLKEKIGLKAYKEAMFGTGSKDSKQHKKIFKRENKNRPMEKTSKKPVSRHKEVMTVKKKVHRDPRFDDLSGEYNEHFFKEAYSFLGDVKQREKMKMLKKYKKEHDPEKKQQLESLIKRMGQQELAEKEKEAKQKRIRERKKKEKELVKEGKKPFYLKKSDQKTLDLAEKYRELKKSGKLDKYLQRKRKKNAGKEKKKLPNKPNF